MSSQSPQNSRPGTARKRSESASAPWPASIDATNVRPVSRDRSQSVTHNEGQRLPPSAELGGTDRVFPIRSVVSVDPTAAQHVSSRARGAVSPTREGARQYSIIDQHTWQNLQSQPQQPQEPTMPTDTLRHETVASNDQAELATHSMASRVAQHPEIYAKVKSDSQSARSGTPQPPSRPLADSNESYGHVTARFKHIMTDSGHAVITGRDGEAFQYCEDEPIRIPGAVQSFGVMIALREESPDQLVVRVVSENAHQFLGYSPKQLFELKSFCDILNNDQADSLLDHIDFVRDDAYDPGVDGPEVFGLTIPTPDGENRRFWCATHVSQAQKDLIICELELEDDETNPLNVGGLETPSSPTGTLGSFPTAEQFAGSTVNISQPLRVLRNARRRRGEAAAMEVFSMLSQIQEQLGRANDLDTLLNTTVGLVKELTGFHRIMIYQFDSSWNGLVVAELVDPKVTIDLYKGLHFPASDIPAQARELYKVNKVRLLYDRDQITSRLVCRTLEDLETPLDMTHSYLRAMSPIHIKYLAHMKVRSSMSISINAFNDLWGLISCHSYGNTGMRVSFPVRKMCRLLGDTVSRNIERLSYASRLQARKLINTVPTEANPSGYIIASSDDLLQLFDADYGALSIRDETKVLGDTTHSQEVLALLEFLRMRQLNTVLASHDIIKDFPDLQYAPGLKAISGLLYVPLSTGGSDFICFFRKGQLTEIKWAGNPYDIAKRKETAGYLEPRSSFAAWRETVLSQSREWSETDVETAAVLCLVYGKFIKVWRQKEAAMQNSQLTKLLLANSAHEVRTPLNAIINYLEIALEGALDSETRESLTKSHSASKSLIYVINDLLDLTNTEKGHELIKDETFDLQTTFREATDMLAGEAKRKNISYTVSTKPGLPRMVVGDQRRVRQVFSNLVSNAIQQTTSGAVTVEMWRSANQTVPGHVGVEMMVLDTGAGMSKSKLEAIFYELEQVSTDDTYYQEEDTSTTQKSETKRALGLGLALVARIIHNMQGQLGVKSEEGKGSRFKILLQFKLPEGVSTEVPPDAVIPSSAAVPPTPMISDREFTLVGGVAERREDRRLSSESLRSGGSSRSGKSHADRLISAIQEPALVQRAFSDSSDPRQVKLSTSPPVSSSHLSANMSSPRSNSLKRASVTHDPLASLSAVTHTPPLALQPFKTPPAPGTANVTDSGVPMGALRVSERDVQRRVTQQAEHQSYFPPVPIPGTEKSIATSASAVPPSTVPTSVLSTTPPLLHVLVAEDDPVNSKIIHKRLTKLGHTVVLTNNGEACANTFTSASQNFDVVLMDLQMPIVDGMTATKMIREFESKTPDSLSYKARQNERIPIFAVSASLLESEKQTYIDTGFDGWVMKPINFTRLNVLLSGLSNRDARSSTSYKPGQWENGGWFNT
ncbi:uncharacterized protein N7496_005570 [Penicillium cataractarum]|uniref:Phytochrome n=1 Tax=Penicillium cataractarum TaxID=2100454 RepID=A0A9W9VG62_9EURO|nr:uncharacterized protein N7496_005570 [Penicillium cataractarum]KAJ5378161.1 hypothetical protein N7496_005570 [Penicillium cataractarum]